MKVLVSRRLAASFSDAEFGENGVHYGFVRRFARYFSESGVRLSYVQRDAFCGKTFFYRRLCGKQRSERSAQSLFMSFLDDYVPRRVHGPVFHQRYYLFFEFLFV